MSNTPFPHRFLARREPGTGERRTVCATPGYGAHSDGGCRVSVAGSGVSRNTHLVTRQSGAYPPIEERAMPTRDDIWPNGTPRWIDVMVTDPAAARDA